VARRFEFGEQTLEPLLDLSRMRHAALQLPV